MVLLNMADVANKKQYRYVFGPVPSRRLGRSLGVDLVPFKTCTYDCIYCQLGRTTVKTRKRISYVPDAVLIEEVRRKLSEKQKIDYITLSGSGEPTLHSHLSPLIRGIKDITDIPVAVLTNGSLLWDEDVRAGIHKADLVIPSLDAGDSACFMRVNRPVTDIDFETMIDGLRRFRRTFRGAFWLEVFLLNRITATEEHVRKMAEHVRSIGPDKVQLNTVVRPPAEKDALSVPQRRMSQFAKLFEPEAEVIADYPDAPVTDGFTGSREDIVRLLKRRPCTVEDIAAGLSIHRNEAIKQLEHLSADNILSIMENEKGVFYFVKGTN
jgi:wyosine [tRNA(Phe)-imidazoG37] synthetase (radical SAM superfamily)